MKSEGLPERWQNHFPLTPEEFLKDFRPFIDIRSLAYKVVVVARTRIEGKWSAYIDAVPGKNHDNEAGAVLQYGTKLGESVARAIFPQFEGVPYAR